MYDLNTIAREVRVCTLCPLSRSRTIAVPGEGPPRARVMFVGEAPGREEDLVGKPFIGRSGKILDRCLALAGLERDAIFITSVVKCRPPDNRVPRRFEMETCVQAYLQRQIQVINPTIIGLLGGTAVRALLGQTRLEAIRGRLVSGKPMFLATYHPAAAGRNPKWRKAFMADLRLLRRWLDSHGGGF